MAEGIEPLRVLFEQPRSSYDGNYRRFVDVESYPKPVQSPLPIFSGGNGKARIGAPASGARDGCREARPTESRWAERKWHECAQGRS